jgi:hypothetical protein
MTARTVDLGPALVPLHQNHLARNGSKSSPFTKKAEVHQPGEIPTNRKQKRKGCRGEREVKCPLGLEEHDSKV